MNELFLGIDLGSSSVKVSILDGASGQPVGSGQYPKNEMEIMAPAPGWAEQNPENWWKNFLKAYWELVEKFQVNTGNISAIGITYQMHGLVVVDEEYHVLRPSIIWCDSRAVDLGSEAFRTIGEEKCLQELLNSPGNFTASKLGWVKKNEPKTFSKVHKFMLPGDYLALRLGGEITTTSTGLSEGTFWDFESRTLSGTIMNYFGFSNEMVPEQVPSMGKQLLIDSEVANKLGLRDDVWLTYRAGDQPNNAFSLNVLHPGEIAATAGTSGVVYAVTDQNVYDSKSRINTFLHVNDSRQQPRNGILICVNGTGILYRWIKQVLTSDSGKLDYKQMNERANSAPAGSDGIRTFPFGNGAERILENRLVNGHIMNLDFNRHGTAHLLRSAMEGIVFALNLGFEILKSNQVPYDTIRAGKANLFLSPLFRSIFADVSGCKLEIFDTDGAIGAARGAALGAGFYESGEAAFQSLNKLETVEPNPDSARRYRQIYQDWADQLQKIIQ